MWWHTDTSKMILRAEPHACTRPCVRGMGFILPPRPKTTKFQQRRLLQLTETRASDVEILASWRMFIGSWEDLFSKITRPLLLGHVRGIYRPLNRGTMLFTVKNSILHDLIETVLQFMRGTTSRESMDNYWILPQRCFLVPDPSASVVDRCRNGT